MTRRLAALLGTFTILVLAGCHDPSDTPPPPAAASALPQGGVQLDIPLTAEAARAAQASNSGAQRKQSALVVGGQELAVDTSNREAVRLFYNRLYLEPAVPMDWTGSHATGTAGATSAAFQASTLQRLNWFRAMAGLSAAVSFSPAYNAKAQEAALMMSANGQLSHTPPDSWKFYTAAGAEAAGSSNLALGSIGPDAITAYISDYGDNNTAVGHRRWLFYPQTRTFGTGDVPAPDGAGGSGRVWGANALWVFDGNYGKPRPRVRDDFVAWPSKGFVPYQVVFSRWSLSYPDADFSQARVSVTRDGVPVEVQLEPLQNSAGENTIVWQLAGAAPNSRHGRPEADITYRVSVSNVLLASQPRSFAYDVVVFDPAMAASGALRPIAHAPASVQAGQAYRVQVGAVPGATGYSLRTYLRKPLQGANPAPFDTTGWTLTGGLRESLSAPGILNFYRNSDNYGDQAAVLNRKLSVAPAGGSVTLTRTIRLSSPKQRFQVQVSADDGATWNDAYAEPGRVSRQDETAQIRVPLDRFAGSTLRLRLLSSQSGEYYTGQGTGWSVSAIAFDGVGELVDEREALSADGSFSFTLAQPGSYLHFARAQLQGLYYSDDGAPAETLVDGAILRGPRSAYTLTRRDGLLTVIDNAGVDGTQVVRFPFRLDFTDITLAFDVDGNAGKSYRLYRAAFNRQPDAGGLGFWIMAMDGGLGIESMAREFARSAEFAGLYGAAPTPDAIIAALYRNVLHRLPDAAGAAYWRQQMDGGLRVEQILVEFSESAENKGQVAAEIEFGIGFARH